MNRTMRICLLISLFFIEPALAINWPNNAKSAVSITADDGWHSQLTQANILDQYGFRGTFYLTVTMVPSYDIASWRSVFLRGHEVGNHSYYHNCDLTQTRWSDVATDVSYAEWWLVSNIYSMNYTDHTYAYPCGNYIVGPQNTSQERQVGACEYAALLSAVVTGARTTDGPENDPARVAQRRFFINGTTISGSDATAIANAKAAIDAGITNGTWTVLIFHSLGDSGDGLAITQDAYTQIVSYLYQRRAELWVAPVVNVKRYIQNNTPYSDWSCRLH